MLRSARRGDLRGGLKENKENAVEPTRGRRVAQSGLASPAAGVGPTKPADRKLFRRNHEVKPVNQPTGNENAPSKRTPLANTPKSLKTAQVTGGNNRTGVLSVKQVNVQNRPFEAHPGSAYHLNKVRPSSQALADEGQATKISSTNVVPLDLRKALASVALAKQVEKDGAVSRKKVAFSEPGDADTSSDAVRETSEDGKVAEDLLSHAQVPGRSETVEPQVFPHIEEEIEYQPPRAEALPWDPGFEVDFTPLFLKPPDSNLYYLPRPSVADVDGPGVFVNEKVQSVDPDFYDADDYLLAYSGIDVAAAQIRNDEFIVFDAIEV